MLGHLGPLPIEEALIVGTPAALMLAGVLRLRWRARMQRRPLVR